MPKQSLVTKLLLGFLLLLVALRLSALVTDYWWFSALGFEKIFTVSLQSAVIVFLISGITFFLFLMVNFWVAMKLRGPLRNLLPFRLKFNLALIFSFIVGTASSGAWLTVMRYLNSVPFAINEPIFGKDLGFYVFTLPFYLSLWRFAMACIAITAILVLLDYFQSAVANLFRPDPQRPLNIKQEFAKLKKSASLHISLLVAAVFVLLSVSHYLARYDILYSTSGIVVGAGYTDVHVVLPLRMLLMVFSLLIAAIFLASMFSGRIFRRGQLLLYAVATYFLLSVIGISVIPGLVQSFRVLPNEFNLEQPYLENSINITRFAYGLDRIEESVFTAEDALTIATIQANPETINNIRILDWRPLTATYRQMQEIRLYYDLSEIDIDRYYIDGQYTQVLLSARELDQSKLADNAKTWVNLHMVFTHGYGAVMSPVNRVTGQGHPAYLIQDIPPQYSTVEPGIRIERPEIYYGETGNEFVIVNSRTKEFNYPKGEANEFINYGGTGGVVLDSFWKKLLMAVRFSDIKILLSEDITEESRIMLNRRIQERVTALTPFLMLDSDPYIVISDGGLYWIQDAYTMTGAMPYSKSVGSVNYIRNSVKVVIDAYNGDVTYYMMENEPLIKAYANIFPGVFSQFGEMPADLQKHVRYPEGLFRMQSEILRDYHMREAGIFYNKEDAWQLPKEIYGSGEQITVEPYFIIMKLPGQEREEFVLMTPFTPTRRDNMAAWLAGRSDPPHYGQLRLYRFPKDKLVYGPSQVEAKIDQDAEISELLTLWSQQGSRVTRGNLLVIPLGNSLLYAEPLYLQSELGQLPELKRVIVSDGERIAHAPSLGEALEILLGKAQSKIPEERQTDEQLIELANSLYLNILESMQKGNWSAFGTSFDRLGNTLQALLGNETTS